MLSGAPLAQNPTVAEWHELLDSPMLVLLFATLLQPAISMILAIDIAAAQ